ncbi:hypothetical protein T07_9327, partial [Trichinella nelsoni]
LCMASRLLIESGCLRLQPKAGGRETVDRQTDGADGAILTKISRRWVRWRMNLLQTSCLCCVDYLSFRIYARCTFGRSASRATFANVFAADRTIVDQSVSERAHWYPKDGELCLSRMKPEETLVEVRSGVDVQITRLT